MIKFENENFKKILKLKEIRKEIDYRLNINFNIYNQNYFSHKDFKIEIYLDYEIEIENDIYYFSLYDIDSNLIFKIEIFKDNFEMIYNIIKNYIYNSIKYNQDIFDEEN